MGAAASIPVTIESLSAEDVANLVKSIGPAYERYRSLLFLVIILFSINFSYNPLFVGTAPRSTVMETSSSTKASMEAT